MSNGDGTETIYLGHTRSDMASGPQDLRAHGHEVMDVEDYWIPEGTRADSTHWLSALAGTELEWRP